MPSLIIKAHSLESLPLKFSNDKKNKISQIRTGDGDVQQRRVIMIQYTCAIPISWFLRFSECFRLVLNNTFEDFLLQSSWKPPIFLGKFIFSSSPLQYRLVFACFCLQVPNTKIIDPHLFWLPFPVANFFASYVTVDGRHPKQPPGPGMYKTL